MPSFRLNNTTGEIDKAVSGSYQLLFDFFTGSLNLRGEAYFDYLNASGIGVQNDIYVTGDSTTYGDIIGFSNNSFANLNSTGNSFISNLTGNTILNTLQQTGGWAEINQIRGGLQVSGNSAFSQNVGITGNLSNQGNSYLEGNHYQTGEIHVNGDAYITGATRITGSLYINGVQITGNGGAAGGGGGTGASPFSYFTQRGQLFVGTGNGTGILLNTGQSGQKLIVDPSQTEGVRWATDAAVGNTLDYWIESATTGQIRFSPVSGDPYAMYFGHASQRLRTIFNAKSFTLNPAEPDLLGDNSVNLQINPTATGQLPIGTYSTIGGGKSNLIDALSTTSFVAGGESNSIANSQYSFIGCGLENRIEDGTGIAVFGSFGYGNRYGEFVISNRERQAASLLPSVNLGASTTGELFLNRGAGNSERISINSVSMYDVKVMGYNSSSSHMFSKRIEGLVSTSAIVSRSDTTLYADSGSFGLDLKVVGGNLQLVGTGNANMQISAEVNLLENFEKQTYNPA